MKLPYFEITVHDYSLFSNLRQMYRGYQKADVCQTTSVEVACEEDYFRICLLIVFAILQRYGWSNRLDLKVSWHVQLKHFEELLLFSQGVGDGELLATTALSSLDEMHSSYQTD
jgi:hypothetical protein